MRRFPPRNLPPREPEGSGRQQPGRRGGPFDRILRPRSTRDPAPIIIAATVFFLIVVIAILAFASFSPFTGGGGDEGEIVFEAEGIRGISEKMPDLPPQLEAASQFVVFEATTDVGATIGIPLDSTFQDLTGLRFYSFLSGQWRQVADVTPLPATTLAESGCLADATGGTGLGRPLACADFPAIPQNLVVLRRLTATDQQVAGSLPAGGTIHPNAIDLLDILNPRDYAPAGDGSVAGTASNVSAGADSLTIPTIVGSDDAGAAAVTAIVSDPNLSESHIQNIVSLVDSGGFEGIDLEYSRLEEGTLRSQFTLFVTTLAQRLHDNDHRLILTLPAATSDSEAGAYDWAVLGQPADLIKILPPADPSTYWERMPNAVRFAAANVDPRKLFLAVSPSSLRLQGTDVSAIGYLQAMFQAAALEVRAPEDPQEIVPGAEVTISALNLDPARGASGIQWSDEVAAVTFSFPDETGTTTVFVQNAFSLAFKLELVQAFNLGGVAVMDASAESDVADIWQTVRDMKEIGIPLLLRPNPAQLAPQWEVPDGGDISVGDRVGAAIWNTPSLAGSYRIVLIVSDGVLRFSRGLQVEVTEGGPTPTPTGTPTATPELFTPTPTPEATPTATPTPTPTPEATPTATPTPTPTPEPTPTPPPPPPTPTPTPTPPP